MLHSAVLYMLTESVLYMLTEHGLKEVEMPPKPGIHPKVSCTVTASTVTVTTAVPLDGTPLPLLLLCCHLLHLRSCLCRSIVFFFDSGFLAMNDLMHSHPLLETPSQ
jgi:hypothetical protein